LLSKAQQICLSGLRGNSTGGAIGFSGSRNKHHHQLGSHCVEWTTASEGAQVHVPVRRERVVEHHSFLASLFLVIQGSEGLISLFRGGVFFFFSFKGLTLNSARFGSLFIGLATSEGGQRTGDTDMVWI
jgi:hypothetical protein